jgi:hypothetical protein
MFQSRRSARGCDAPSVHTLELTRGRMGASRIGGGAVSIQTAGEPELARARFVERCFRSTTARRPQLPHCLTRLKPVPSRPDDVSSNVWEASRKKTVALGQGAAAPPYLVAASRIALSGRQQLFLGQGMLGTFSSWS